MTAPKKRGAPHSNQARPELDFQDVRGLISIAENDGNVYAYRGSLPSTGPSTGPKTLYGHIRKTTNKGHAFGYHEMPEGHGGLQAKGETRDSRSESNSHAFHGQTNSRDYPPLTSEMLAEFLALPPNLQEMMRNLLVGERYNGSESSMHHPSAAETVRPFQGNDELLLAEGGESSPYKPKSPSCSPEGLSCHDTALKLSGIDSSQVLDVQGGDSGEDAHASRSIPAVDECMSSNMCLNAAVDVVARLVESKRDIEALFRDIGVSHNDMVAAAGFDEEVFASSGVLIQQAHILIRVDLAVDEDRIMHLLDALGKTLSPYSGVVSTPSRNFYSSAYQPSGISFHNDPLGVSQDSVAKEQGATDGRKQGNDKKQVGEGSSDREAERESPQSNSLGGSGGGVEGNLNLQTVETDDSEVELKSSVRHVASGFPDPNDDPPKTPKPGHNVHFEVKFDIKHIMQNQAIIVKGTVQSEEIPEASLPHAAPHSILSTRIQFLGLDFYGNAGKTGYRQSCAVVKIDVGKDQARFQLFDVNPQPTPRQDTKMKQMETNERTGQHQLGFSTNFTFSPFKPTLGGNYMYTNVRKFGRTEERSVNINRITQSKTGRDMYWCYDVDDEYLQENGLRDLTPSASFSFFGSKKKPEKLKTEIKSIWTMPDAGVWDMYMQFTNTVPLRNLATQVTLDIPPHMDRSWTIFRDLAVTMIPRDKGFGVNMQMEFNEVHGDIEPQDFQAFIT